MSSARPLAPPVERLAIVGAGLIGASVALAAAGRGSRVAVHDADPAVRRRAAEVGIPGVAASLADAVADAELVVVAVPSGAVAAVVMEVLALAPGAVVTDVAGLKAPVVDAVERGAATSGRDASRFVGGHPMAGSERSGPEAADAALFQGAAWVLTPTERTDDEALRRASAFVAGCGARALVLGPERHDELVAIVSHLPQLVASALVDTAAESVDELDALLAVAGPGFRDTTRVAAGDAAPWAELVLGNAPALVAALDALGARLAGLSGAIAAGRGEDVTALLARASDARRRLVPKSDAPGVDLVVPVRDEPGALAVVTRVLGEAGINVEDLSMRHATHGGVGALLVRVRADAQARALRALGEAGVAAHVDGERLGG